MTDAGTSYDSSFADGIPSPPSKITGEKHDIESGHEPSAAVAIVRSIEKKQRVEVEVEVEQKQKQPYDGSGNNKPSTPGHRPALALLSDNKPPPSTSSNLGNDTDEFGKTKLGFDEVASTATTSSSAAASTTASSSSAATAAGAAVSKLSTAKAIIDRRSQHYFGKNIDEETALHLHQEIALYDSSTPNDLRSLDCTNHVPSTKITAKRRRTLEAMNLLHYKTMAFSSQSGPQPTTPLPLPSSSKVAENKAAYKLRPVGEVVSGDAVFCLLYCFTTNILVYKTNTMCYKDSNTGKVFNHAKNSVHGVFGVRDFPLDYTNVPKHMIKTETNSSSNFVVINKEWLRTCQEKGIPFRRFFRPVSVSYEKWTTTDVTPGGLERWEELKQCMKASFVGGAKSQGQVAVYNAVECDEEEGETIQSGDKHYRQGSTELATYNSLSQYRKTSEYYSSWGKTDPKRPTAYNTVLKERNPSPLFKDVRNEYPNGFLWKAQNDMLVWVRKH